MRFRVKNLAESDHQFFINGFNSGLKRFFDRIWQAGLDKYDELKGIDRGCQSVDGCQLKSPLAQKSVGPNPTDRGKK